MRKALLSGATACPRRCKTDDGRLIRSSRSRPRSRPNGRGDFRLCDSPEVAGVVDKVLSEQLLRLPECVEET